PLPLHSFPTRRSSDLARPLAARQGVGAPLDLLPRKAESSQVPLDAAAFPLRPQPGDHVVQRAVEGYLREILPIVSGRNRCAEARSEEHTSELQSLAYL